MTTYLLHGGGTSKESSENDRFFAQLTELVDKPEVKILLCYWSRNSDEWEKLQARDIAKILKNTRKRVSFHVVKDQADLFAQIDSTDTLFVAGGDADLLEPFYKDLTALKDKLDGKVYAGSSMGAFLVSEQYVLSNDNQDSDTVHKGVGLLPIQTLCHWNVEDKKAMKLSLLKESKPDLPILTLDECQFVTMYL